MATSTSPTHSISTTDTPTGSARVAHSTARSKTSTQTSSRTAAHPKKSAKTTAHTTAAQSSGLSTAAASSSTVKKAPTSSRSSKKPASSTAHASSSTTRGRSHSTAAGASAPSLTPPPAPIPPLPAPFSTITRIPIVDVTPVVENGAWPAKAVERESFPVQATIFREGHDLFGAECVLFDPHGHEVQTCPMVDVRPGEFRFEGWLTPQTTGDYTFAVRAWSDPIATWTHNASIKIDNDQDIDLVFREGVILFKRALAQMKRGSDARATLRDAIAVMNRKRMSAKVRLEAATSPEVTAALAQYPLRDFPSESAHFKVRVEREAALVGAWYEMFPRTAGAHFDAEHSRWISGTFASAEKDLERIAGMGFTVIYLTPIHPIGTTARKGRNNSLTALPDDPGSPYAIGSAEGGHDAIHPDLGTFADFDHFVARAHELGMEVALDIALQCSPDHPWVTQHPQWFTQRADGSIAYAENPPKKYQDIYPLNFDNDPEGIYQEVKRILELWLSHGVTMFRVDNPHTKPLSYWQRLFDEFHAIHPDVVFLGEAHTNPPMMQTLAKVGFQQSYTYFPWRTEKKELEDYLWEVARVSDSHFRPCFWPTTHDVLTPFMQRGGVPAFAIRAVLAATGSPSWGIYSGYELAENIARPGSEEQIDNEKYEYKERNYEAAQANGIAQLLGTLNEIRSRHLALRRLRDLRIHPTSSDKIICFSKVSHPEESSDGQRDMVIVVVNMDPYASRDATINLDLSHFGAHPRWDDGPVLEVYDEMSGATFEWNQHPYVRLDPHGAVAHILSVKVINQ
ncbi:MAG: alpha-1,4-glucan--maltose-1-phosphate maltosyltransferase [Actinomycetaceae bacterium]|nr:alpha-1,4-glucan--maltose-1-phosphate maltosyltransferase [Actinomycetaceae bacterium]